MSGPDPADPVLRGFSRSLPMALLQAREAVMNRFRPLLREAGVTEQQWRVLRALDGGGPLDAGEVARRCCLLTPSLTRIVKTLAAGGLVARRQDPGDLRRLVLDITPAGRALIARVAPLSEARYAEITALFGAANLDDLHAKLAALVAALDETAD
ncbi:MAG: homoprotocatechuate degradation operon regulator HpaR [Hyphomicrobiales bacterium]|nr:homoprotocatechuate degradation operon regulator HpaR [Hyphomicrobiales bacterium]